MNPQLAQKCQRAVSVAESKIHRLVDQHPDFFPIYTVNGRWKHSKEPWTNWCEGFLGGQMWLLYLQTQDEWWRGQAEHYSRLVEDRKTDRDVHDLGFIFWPTWKRWYDLDGRPEIDAVVVEAGETLALRFMENGRYLHSFIAPESLFIDIMMNVGLIFYAAQRTERSDLLRVAIDHCHTTRRTLVRGDGSTAHEGIFNLETGEFLRQSTHQGWRGDSSWARGQAWALYGFGTAYVFSGEKKFLKTAQDCADYYLEQTGSSGVPPNDWLEPDPQPPYESSAAAIAASGLLNLAQLVHHDHELSQHYLNAACSILDTLTEPEFLSAADPGWEGVLKHGIYHQDKGLGVDESVMWGEFFFLEAVCKILEQGKNLGAE